MNALEKLAAIDDDLAFEIVSAFLKETGQEDAFGAFAKQWAKQNPSKVYDSEYGDDKACVCGHPYYRHFDTYENMRHVGCKYCGCFDFKPE